MKGDRIADQVPIQGNISIISKDKWYIIIKGVSEFLWKKKVSKFSLPGHYRPTPPTQGWLSMKWCRPYY